ncbi:MAG: recombinase family protein [Thermodesulfobacteriota bacterium]
MDNKPKAYSYIRFSTPEQEKGDSLRRQEMEAEEYAAKELGLKLDESQKFKDLGISGYKGINRIDGALNKFIELVDKREIPKGSVLIVEHLDRLSREKVSDALTSFLNLIKEGIKIVTLQDKRQYDKDIIDKNPTELLISIILMSAAHDESRKKSIRVREATKEKRRKLSNNEIKRFSTRCPLWVKWSDKKEEFVPIPEVCDVIKLIFKKRLEGKGSYKIEKELNLEPNVWKPPIKGRNKSGGWREAYINKILRSRSVIGEFQPHEIPNKEEGEEVYKSKRVPVGDPIKNYYPKIIDEGTFYRVQEIIEQNSKFPGNAGGGNTDKAKNLFTNIVKCGICGSSMVYLHTGKDVWQYLVCDSAKRKNKVQIPIEQDPEQIEAIVGAKMIRDITRKTHKIPKIEVHTELKVCNARHVPYNEFEKIFFENFEELDVNKFLPNEDATTKLKKEKENKMSANMLKLSDLDSQIDNLLETISRIDDEKNKIVYEKKVTEKHDASEKLIAKNKKLEQEIKNLAEKRLKLSKQKDSIKEAYSFLKSAKDDQERIHRRFQLRQEIKNMIEWIKIHTKLDKYQNNEEIEPGRIRIVKSKSIDRIRIKFRGSYKLRAIFLNITADTIDMK